VTLRDDIHELTLDAAGRIKRVRYTDWVDHDEIYRTHHIFLWAHLPCLNELITADRLMTGMLRGPEYGKYE
jgi:hypothetical protein